MAADRERILADFQACTGNDDIGICIAILEEHNWDLMEALQNSMAGMESPSVQAPPAPPSEDAAAQAAFSSVPFSNPDDFNMQMRSMLQQAGVDGGAAAGAAVVEGASLFGNSSTLPSTSRPLPVRLLNFIIEYRDRNIKLTVPDNETVGKIKELLQVETTVEPSQMRLCGWVHKNDASITDEDVLRDLRLPKENTLFLLTPHLVTTGAAAAAGAASNNGESSASILERLGQDFQLFITDLDNHRDYTLKFPGSKTIQEVKSDVFHLINVPVRNQEWTGWPSQAIGDDTMTLAGSNISYPLHRLQVKAATQSTVQTRHSTRQQTHEVINLESDEDEADDFEDASEQFNTGDDMFEEEPESVPRRAQPLMPENATNQTEALECFSREFASRYGECHPVFYMGKLEDALKDSLHCSAKDRKQLAIYLHHDSSILANVFCSQILCAESVVSYLSNNFITWAWDLTAEINKARLLTECTRHFGSVAANTVRNFKLDQLPLLLIISRNRATNEVVQVIHGSNSLDELMTCLIHAQEVFTEQQRSDILDENERDQRESMLREQDNAYQMSLAADRLKKEERMREEEEQRRIQEEAIRQQQEEIEKQKEEDMKKEAIRQSVADQLPDEPSRDCKHPVSTIRVRCPEGVTLTRRFLADHPLQVLLNYITAQGFHTPDEYKVLTTFPRRDLTTVDAQQSLKELKLYPQETLTLEEK